MKFYSKDTSLRNMTHNTSIPNLNSTILCLFLAEISMKFHSKSTSLRNMTCNSSIQNHDFMKFCLFLLKLSMTFHSKDTSLRIMVQTTSIPHHNLSIWCLFWPEIEYEVLFKRDLLEKYDTKHFYSKSNFFNSVLIFGWN